MILTLRFFQGHRPSSKQLRQAGIAHPMQAPALVFANTTINSIRPRMDSSAEIADLAKTLIL